MGRDGREQVSIDRPPLARHAVVRVLDGLAPTQDDLMPQLHLEQRRGNLLSYRAQIHHVFGGHPCAPPPRHHAAIAAIGVVLDAAVQLLEGDCTEYAPRQGETGQTRGSQL